MINSKGEKASVVFSPLIYIRTHIYIHISGYLNFKLGFTITSVVIVIKKNLSIWRSATSTWNSNAFHRTYTITWRVCAVRTSCSINRRLRAYANKCVKSRKFFTKYISICVTLRLNGRSFSIRLNSFSLILFIRIWFRSIRVLNIGH